MGPPVAGGGVVNPLGGTGIGLPPSRYPQPLASTLYPLPPTQGLDVSCGSMPPCLYYM